CCLAGPIRSEKAHDLALLDLERDLVHGRITRVPLGELFHADHKVLLLSVMRCSSYSTGYPVRLFNPEAAFRALRILPNTPSLQEETLRPRSYQDLRLQCNSQLAVKNGLIANEAWRTQGRGRQSAQDDKRFAHASQKSLGES